MQGIKYYFVAYMNAILRLQDPLKMPYALLFVGLGAIGSVIGVILILTLSQGIWIFVLIGFVFWLFLWILFLGWIASKFLMRGYL